MAEQEQLGVERGEAIERPDRGCRSSLNRCNRNPRAPEA
jgi:hypothetical protein